MSGNYGMEEVPRDPASESQSTMWSVIILKCLPSVHFCWKTLRFTAPEASVDTTKLRHPSLGCGEAHLATSASTR